MYRLHIQGNGRNGRRLLVRQKHVVFGSGEGCGLRVASWDCPEARLLEFAEEDGGVVLRRLAPGGTVKVDGEEVGGAFERRLRHGDEVEVGRVGIRYEEVIPPTEGALRPTAGILQVMTALAAGAVLVVEAALFAFTLDWSGHIITQNEENVEKAVAERERALKEAQAQLNPKSEEGEKRGGGSVVVGLPVGGGLPGGGGEGEVPETVRTMLGDADFAPAEIGEGENLAVVQAQDLVQESLARLLQEAETAANFADYPGAFRVLEEIHQRAPEYLEAYRVHAKLLEERGDLEAACQRWTQLAGLAGGNAEVKEAAMAARAALLNRLQAQKRVFSQGIDRESLPRTVRLTDVEIQKLPSDEEIAEMRVLRGWVVLGPEYASSDEKPLTLHVTFFDQETGGRPVATRFLTTPSPIAITRGKRTGKQVPFEATYIVPAVRDPRTQEALPFESLYYGYTLHLFAGDELEDAAAAPPKLLGMPLQNGGGGSR